MEDPVEHLSESKTASTTPCEYFDFNVQRRLQQLYLLEAREVGCGCTPAIVSAGGANDHRSPRHPMASQKDN